MARKQVENKIECTKKTEQERVALLDDKSLLNETLSMAQGDDYDGCFTSNGRITMDLLEAELRRRFLKEEK